MEYCKADIAYLYQSGLVGSRVLTAVLNPVEM